MSREGFTKNLHPWAAAFLAAFFLQYFAAGFYRLVQVSFPLNMVAVFILCYLLLGVPLGALWQSRKGPFTDRTEWVLLLLLALFLLASTLNKDVSIHYFLGNLYYPYPAPPHAWLHTTAQAVSILLSFLPVFFLAACFAERFSAAREGYRDYAVYLLGLLAGAAASFVSVQWFGGHLALALACGGCLLFLRDWKRALLGLVAFTGLAAAGVTGESIPFLWQVRQYDRLESRWTPYYKVDFVRFNEDRCLGGVYNHVMIWYTCNDPALLPTPLARVHQAAARDSHRILVAGRAEGTCPLLVRQAHPDGRRITSLEYDPVVVDRMNGAYAPYNDGIFLEPDMEAVSGDLRQWIRGSAEPFDMIYLNGIGNRLYTLPQSFVFQEDYLLTRESMEDLFENRLAEDGLLLLDWGSSKEDEAFMYMANLPEGVHARILWQALSEYPMMGMPLFTIFASRDPQRVDSVVEEILRIDPAWREIPVTASLELYRYADNRPFIQKDLPVYFLLASVPLLVLILGVTRYSFRHARAAFRDLPGLPLYLLCGGLVFAFLQALVLSRHARLFPAGAPVGALYLSSALLLGFLLPHLFFRGLPFAARRMLVLLSPAALAGALACMVFSDHPVVLTLAALGGGLFTSPFWLTALGRTAREIRWAAYGLQGLGMVWGIYLLQWWVGLGGYRVTTIFCCVLSLLTALFYTQRVARTKPLQGG